MGWSTLFVSLGVVMFLLHLVPGLVYVERKVCAWIQNRAGPNRVGPFGFLQPVADAIKLLTKEEIVPEKAERGLYYLAPFLAFVPVALAFAVIPFGKPLPWDGGLIPMQVADLDVGVMFVLSIGSIGVWGLAFAGWAGNSKYSMLGGLRSAAQMVSYEIALGLAIVAVLMVSGSVSTSKIVESQQGVWLGFLPKWNVFTQPVAAIIFLVAAFAENNRLPFDLPEAEPELVAGYHTEYSGMKFATFMLGEYVAMITMSALMVTMFFGGWSFPGLDGFGGILGTAITVGIFMAKLLSLLFFYIWVRWTLPRFRYDQLMTLGWKTLIPLGLANVLVTGLLGVL